MGREFGVNASGDIVVVVVVVIAPGVGAVFVGFMVIAVTVVANGDVLIIDDDDELC